jgi:hypothetical protein
MTKMAEGLNATAAVFASVRVLVELHEQAQPLYRKLNDVTRRDESVQHEDVRKLENRVASGDGIYTQLTASKSLESAASELKDTMIGLQSRIIASLLPSVEDTPRWFASIDSAQLKEISDAALRALTTLSRQQPLDPVPLSTGPDDACEGARLLRIDRNVTLDEVCGACCDFRGVTCRPCNYCSGYMWGNQERVKGTPWSLSLRFLHKSHVHMKPTEKTFVDLRCILCDLQKVFSAPRQLAQHVESYHHDYMYWRDPDINVAPY